MKYFIFHCLLICASAYGTLDNEEIKPLDPLDQVLLCEGTYSSYPLIHDVLSRGANPNCRSIWGETPLMIAAREGAIRAMQLLLERGVDIDAETNNGENAVSMAVENRKACALMLLLNKGAKPTSSAPDRNILASAIQLGDEGVIDLLVEHGAEINKPLHSMTPLMAAVSQRNVELVKRLLEMGAKLGQHDSSLQLAAQYDHGELIELLVKHGADINGKEWIERTALHAAAEQQNHKAVAKLIELGAEVDAVDEFGITPLHVAVGENGKDTATVQLLIARGADVNRPSNEQLYPLHLAASSGSLERCKALIEAGARVDVIDTCGQTALHYAAMSCWTGNPVDHIHYLVAQGVPVNVQDNEGNTSWVIAARRGHTELTSYLLSITE